MGFEHRLDEVVLPKRLTDILRPELPSLAEEIVQEIRATIPSYAKPLDSPYGRSIKVGVQHAIALFITQISDPDAPVQQSRDVHHKLGQQEMHEGRSLDALQAAYRVGARVAWRRIMRVGKRNGLSSTAMSNLADALFAFMDQLASVALDGYLEAKAYSAGAMETWRRRLLRLILETPPAPARAIAELAQLTGWQVPDRAAPVAVQALPGSGHNQRRPMLEADVLVELDGIEPHLLVPGKVTAARVTAIQAALPATRFSVGPGVPLDQVADALRWARKALALAERGVIDSGQVTYCEEQLSSVLLDSDRGLLAQLEERLFSPLRGLTPRQRERMLDTLRAWLEMQGNVPGMADLLGVHPQTVRYRMRQLESTFADRLQDPKLRFEMELVLRAGINADEDQSRLPLPRTR
jgi:hypothetical protein